ncbi:MAG: 7-cyano-7-deazaguanine synthase QueC [Deltaproteobacteria bacterium]
MSKSDRRAVVLLSGGLDSAVTLYYALSRGFKVFCIGFDYGQRHKTELAHARRIAVAAKCPFYPVNIGLPWKGSSLLDKNLKVPERTIRQAMKGIPSTYVPGRNIIFLSFAVSLAEVQGCSSVFIGAHAQDYSGYPDCRPEFYKAFAKAVLKGTKAGVEGKPVKIETPLIDMGKADIIRLGRKLKVPFELTWSCYSGGSRPCGTCDSCLFRAKGFKEAGFCDPASPTA